MSFWGVYSFFYSFVLNEWFPYQKLLKDLISFLEIKNGEKILDAGCGPGFLIGKLIGENQNKEIKVVGLDSTATMIRFAKARCADFPNVGLKTADLNKKIEFPESFFDKIVCCNALYALKDPEKTIGEFYRILKPRGFLIIANPKPNAKGQALLKEHIKSLRELSPFSKKLYHAFLFFLMMPISFVIMLMNRIILEKGKQGEYHFFDKEELEKIFLKAKFKNIKIIPAYANQNWLVRGEK